MEKELTTFVFDASQMDDYARGLISGLMYLLTGRPSETTRWCHACDADFNAVWYKHLDCTVEQAMEIHDEINKLFPGVLLEMS